MMSRVQTSVNATTFLFVLFIVGLMMQRVATAAETKIFCRYEKIAVPCQRLKQAHKIDRRKLQFKPIKAIPIWPNFAIFGGKDEKYNGEAREKDSFYNRTAELPVKENEEIGNIDISQYAFRKDFIDDWLQVYEFTDLFDVRNVFDGSSVFDLWMKAAKVGVICGDSYEDDDGIKVSECAFVRKRVSNARHITWEYCFFEKHTESGVQGDPQCADVAEIYAGTKRILASAYIYYGGDLGYGGGEGEYSCAFPDVQVSELILKTIAFAKNSIGIGGNFDSHARAENDVTFSGEALNIHDNDEHLFKRLYMSGGISTRKGSDGVTAIAGSSFGISSSFTISLQSSEDITDYREPNATMANRLRNRFEQQIKVFANGLSSKAACARTGYKVPI
jgi:hypothetical protein